MPRQIRHSDPGPDLDRLRRLVEAAVAPALDRARILDDVKDALERGDERAAIAAMRQYCGLPTLKVA
jgi:hypothetical protein